MRAFEILRQLLVSSAAVIGRMRLQLWKLYAWPMRARTKYITTREASAATAEQKGENVLLDLDGPSHS